MGTAPTSPANAGADDLLHGFRWGLKTSFIDYVRRMPDGRVWVGDGAFPLGTHDIFFKLDPAPRPAAPGQHTWAFQGDVRITGHAGLLFVRIARPTLVVTDDDATLLVTGTHDEPIGLVTARLAPVATRTGTRVWQGEDVRLTAAGVAVFNDVYADGEPFEPMLVQLPS